MCIVLSALFFLASSSSFAVERSKNVYYSSNTKEKIIALTFDDGPHPRYTKEILKILDAYDIRATFFMIGENISNYPETAEMVVKAGHEIGNHTDTHPSVRHIETSKIQKEMLKAEEKIISLTGEKPNLFRPPEGLCSHRISDMAELMNYYVILWTVDTRDWAGTPANQITHNVLQHVQGGDILLFHDYTSGKNQTVEALKQIIPALKAEGYSFVTVSDLIEKDKK